jgi:hypothetical protein
MADAAAAEGPVVVPTEITVEWVQEVQARMTAASRSGVAALREVLPQAVAVKIFERTERLLRVETPVLEVSAVRVWSAIAGVARMQPPSPAG